MFKTTTRQSADKMINGQVISLFTVSAATLIMGITALLLKSNGALTTASVIFAAVTIALSALLIGYVVMTRNIGEITEVVPAEKDICIAPENTLEEETFILVENVDEEALAEAIAAPTLELSAIDFIDEEDEEDEAGVEVISVVWPERPLKNKIYRYNPNGQKFSVGDHVLVPTRDVASNKDIIRKATIAHANHKIDPDHLKYPLKNIIGIVKVKE